MLHIKSAQYMQQPMPKAMPDQYISQCNSCEEFKDVDELNHGFCEECINAGVVQKCGNCEKLVNDEELTNTERGRMCEGCMELYQGRGTPEGGPGYSGPRRTYYNGPAEGY